MGALKGLAWLILKTGGWKVEGVAPVPKKFVLIAAPHTSNWDFVYMLAYAVTFDVRISWLGKKQMFAGPFAAIWKAIGGIPVDRGGAGNMVDRMAELFSERDALVLTVPVEGTRRYREYWKSGFYHIARAANVPIVMSYLDYRTHRGGFGPAITPSGDIGRDMDTLREFYGDMRGKYPKETGRIRIREEDATDKEAPAA